jgi:hypothetical protein
MPAAFSDHQRRCPRFPRNGTDEPDTERGNEILADIEQGYPGLCEARAKEQKRIGKMMVQAARRFDARRFA